MFAPARSRPHSPSFAAWLRMARPLVPPPSAGRVGDPGLYGRGSAAWHVGRERVLLAAGPAALLLQVAHPLVAAGVAGHSAFRADPFARLRGTLGAMLEVTFADREGALAASRRVAGTHARVRGTLAAPAGALAAGVPYDARDPDLALWVHLTLVHAALSAYESFVGPLPAGERDAYVSETRRQAELFGVEPASVPQTHAAFAALVRETVEGPTLVVDGAARELAAEILHPPMPRALLPAGALLRTVTAGLLPPRLRSAFGLAWGPPERAAFAGAAASSRAAVPALPSSARYWAHYRAALGRTATG